ncbi:MAG: LuxR C-terminal-related transcriptional regulator [Acidimicrobiia bacterium]
MRVQRRALSGNAHRVGTTEIAVASVGEAVITRERMDPGWRWSVDLKPIVKTDLCRALHQIYVVSGRMRILTDDTAESEVGPGDAVVIPPGHDAWVVGDEPCEIIDFSPDYSQLIDAGQAYQSLTDPNESPTPTARAEAAAALRARAERGRLDSGAVELVLGAVGARPRLRRGPCGLTPRELEVLVLIATGASAKQVAHALGIAVKTATTHIERIYTKCGVSTRAEVTHFAIAHGLVSPLTPAETHELRVERSQGGPRSR